MKTLHKSGRQVALYNRRKRQWEGIKKYKLVNYIVITIYGVRVDRWKGGSRGRVKKLKG